jgi:hypothetical protein
MFDIKQSTARNIYIFAHDANGAGVTGVTDGNWTKRISKNGGAFAAMTVTISELENGWYTCQLSTSHTDTLGFLGLSFSATGVIRVNQMYNVLARTTDDLAFPNVSGRGIDVDATGGVEITADQNVNVNKWLTGTPNALIGGKVQAVDCTVDGTSDSGSTTTMVDAARTEADTDYWKGSFIKFTSGTISGQTRLITAFDPATDTITFAPAVTQAVGTQTYCILPAARADVHAWLGSVVNALISGRVDANAQVVGDKTGYALTSGERTSIAEALLKLDLSTITGEASRSVINALRFLRNKWSISGSTLTVTKEDDTTTAFTSALTTDGAANPIVASDPS